MEFAEQHCQQQGKRLTLHRKQILALLLEQQKALSAYELIAIYNEQNDKAIPPMSMYRILAFHESVNLVHKINISNKYIACSHIGCGHSHALPQFLICQQCHRVSEVQSCTNNLAEISRQAEQTGYQLTSPQIELSGICNNCL